MPSKVSDKIEHLAARMDDDVCDVIFHLKSESLTLSQVVNAGVVAFRNRALVTNAAELLPPSKQALLARQPRTERKGRKPEPAELSFASTIARTQINPSDIEEVKTLNDTRLAAAMTTADLGSAIARVRGMKKDRFRDYLPSTLWSSESVRIALGREDFLALRKNKSFLDRLADVYSNQQLGVPRYFAPPRLRSRIDGELAQIAWGVAHVGAPAIWGAFGNRGGGIRVAVLDTGVDANHPDLRGKVKGWAEFDVNGRKVQRSKPHDTDRHGTHVCGTIAGSGESGQFIGIAPEAEIHAGLVLNGRRGGTVAQILAGLDWAIEQRVHVINLSLGGLTLERIVRSPFHRSLFHAASIGISVVAAVGNDGGQTSGTPGNDFFALAVGAVDMKDRCAGFSGGGTHVIDESENIERKLLPIAYSKPDLCAPGVDIRSALPNGKWGFLSGTSMATPHVAGAIALLRSACAGFDELPGFRQSSVIQDIILGTTLDLGERGLDHRFGFGRVDVLKAVDVARRLGY